MTLTRQSIESEYLRLGHRLGWRFLTCPEANIGSASVTLVTINPAGRIFEPAKWSVEDGNAYVIESWKGRAAGEERLQRQVRRLFEMMEVDPHEVLSGYLVPFRSPNWQALPHKPDSMRFGAGLWREVFRQARAKTVVAFGKEIGPQLAEILDARLVERRPAGWGDQTIDEYRFGAEGRMLVLPHLSHYSLFGRAESEPALRAALKPGSASAATPPVAAIRVDAGRPTAVIRLLVAENPKRGKSRLRYDCYRDGMTVSEYEIAVRQKLGADEARICRKDLKWDTDPRRCFIRIERG